MKWYEVMKEVMKLMPLVIQLVDMVEHLFPVGSKGAIKLEMVKGMLTTAATTSGVAVSTVDAVWPVVSALISGIVAIRK